MKSAPRLAVWTSQCLLVTSCLWTRLAGAQVQEECYKAARELARRDLLQPPARFVELHLGGTSYALNDVALGQDARAPVLYSTSRLAPVLIASLLPQFPGSTWTTEARQANVSSLDCQQLFVALPRPYLGDKQSIDVIRSAYKGLPSAYQRLTTLVRSSPLAGAGVTEQLSAILEQSPIESSSDCSVLAIVARAADLTGAVAEMETTRLRTEVVNQGLASTSPTDAAVVATAAFQACQVAFARGDFSDPAQCPLAEVVDMLGSDQGVRTRAMVAATELLAIDRETDARRRLQHAVAARISVESLSESCRGEAARVQSAMFVDLGGKRSAALTNNRLGLGIGTGLLSGVRFIDRQVAYAGPVYLTAGFSVHAGWFRTNVVVLNAGEYATLDSGGDWRDPKAEDIVAPAIGVGVARDARDCWELGVLYSSSRPFSEDRSHYLALTMGAKLFPWSFDW